MCKLDYKCSMTINIQLLYNTFLAYTWHMAECNTLGFREVSVPYVCMFCKICDF